jgi:hypothetical protein
VAPVWVTVTVWVPAAGGAAAMWTTSSTQQWTTSVLPLLPPPLLQVVVVVVLPRHRRRRPLRGPEAEVGVSPQIVEQGAGTMKWTRIWTRVWAAQVTSSPRLPARLRVPRVQLTTLAMAVRKSCRGQPAMNRCMKLIEEVHRIRVLFLVSVHLFLYVEDFYVHLTCVMVQNLTFLCCFCKEKL